MFKNIFKNIINIFRRKGKKNMLKEKLEKLLADGVITQEEFDALLSAVENQNPTVEDPTNDNEPKDNEPPVEETTTTNEEVPPTEEEIPPVEEETPTEEEVPPGNDPEPVGTGKAAVDPERFAALEQKVELILQKLEGQNKPQEVANPVGQQRQLFGYSKH